MADITVEKLEAVFLSGVKGHAGFRDTMTIQVDSDQWHDVALFFAGR